jgi:hypothetical protein
MCVGDKCDFCNFSGEIVPVIVENFLAKKKTDKIDTWTRHVDSDIPS